MLLETTAIATPPAADTADLPAGRGPVRRTRWYHVVAVGLEPITASDGTVTQGKVIDGLNLEVPDTYLGLGTRDRIEAAAAERGKEVIESWPIARPIAA